MPAQTYGGINDLLSLSQQNNQIQKNQRLIRISFTEEKLTGYGWTTVSNMDSLQLLQDTKENERNDLKKQSMLIN